MEKPLVAVGILKVYHVMEKEYRIDNAIIRSFGWEKEVTLVGIRLIIVEYVLGVWFYALHDIVVMPSDVL